MGTGKSTSAWIPNGETPDCPHCDASMDEASFTLADLIAALSGDGDMPWNLEGRLPRHPDGYALAANPHSFLQLTCLECKKPSLFSTSGQQAYLTPTRTIKDEALLYPSPTPEAK